VVLSGNIRPTWFSRNSQGRGKGQSGGTGKTKSAVRRIGKEVKNNPETRTGIGCDFNHTERGECCLLFAGLLALWRGGVEGICPPDPRGSQMGPHKHG